MNYSVLFFIILNNILLLNSYSIVLPFKKLSPGDFSGNRTLEDFMTFSLYTNILVGMPPHKVAHFIDTTQYSFIYQRGVFTNGEYKLNDFLSQKDDLTDFWYDKSKSRYYKKNETTGLSSDAFFFLNLKKENLISENIKFKIPEKREEDVYKCGSIGLNKPSESDYKLDEKVPYFINELINNKIISGYTFTFFYEENKSNALDYNPDEKYGTLIIGEKPHEYYSNKYNKKELVSIESKDWTITVDSIRFNSKDGDFMEKDAKLQINLISGFIKGTEAYRRKIEEIFFGQLIENKSCRTEKHTDNIYSIKYIAYSCNNDDKMNELIKQFPTLYFELSNNLKFMFNYDELFKVLNDRIYFLVFFLEGGYARSKPKWSIGEILLRKYLTVFNYNTKEISFYKDLVEQVNKESEKRNDSNLVKLFKITDIFLIGLIIVWVAFLLYRKKMLIKKVNSTELEKGTSMENNIENKEEMFLENQN